MTATSAQNLHASLLRPAVIHILRATGFHSARPAVVDTLTELCARYLMILASATAGSVYDRSTKSSGDDGATGAQTQFAGEDQPALEAEIPTVTDIRMALSSAAFFSSTSTSAEETWRELLRKPLYAYPAGARDKERKRRDVEDTRDVQDFLDWITGPVNKEIRRVAGTLPEDAAGASFGLVAQSTEVPAEKAPPKDDFLAILKKKHSKTGDEARYAGTVLGKDGEDKGRVKIEGGPGSLLDWREELKRKRRETMMADTANGKKRG